MIYLCEPFKNTACSKGATCGRDCVLTTHKEYARDGRYESGIMSYESVMEAIDKIDDGLISTTEELREEIKDLANWNREKEEADDHERNDDS